MAEQKFTFFFIIIKICATFKRKWLFFAKKKKEKTNKHKKNPTSDKKERNNENTYHQVPYWCVCKMPVWKSRTRASLQNLKTSCLKICHDWIITRHMHTDFQSAQALPNNLKPFWFDWGNLSARTWWFISLSLQCFAALTVLSLKVYFVPALSAPPQGSWFVSRWKGDLHITWEKKCGTVCRQ